MPPTGRMARILSKSRVTEKYQVTIPKDVRERVKLSPGEIVSIEPLSQDEIRLRRFPRINDPLSVLVGKKGAKTKKSVPIEELEEKIESES